MHEVVMNGVLFNVADEPADFWSWVNEGRYDSEWAILKAFLKPEHAFLDLGAWVGSHSLYASTIARHVLAVEPDPVAYAILEQNIKGHRIAACRGAITDYEGIITLGSGLLGASTTRANPNAGSGIGPWEEGQNFETPCTILRNFVDQSVLLCERGPMFIKLDVEGSEEDILKDVEFFAEHKPTMYLELHPFWWNNEAEGWKAVAKVASLYKRVLNLQMKPIDLGSVYPRSLILTDEES